MKHIHKELVLNIHITKKNYNAMLLKQRKDDRNAGSVVEVVPKEAF